jgi:hypothetical protein
MSLEDDIERILDRYIDRDMEPYDWPLQPEDFWRFVRDVKNALDDSRK